VFLITLRTFPRHSALSASDQSTSGCASGIEAFCES
jgi:hypothetical protein